MIDPILERRYSDCRELLNLWRRFHDFFKIAVAGEGLAADKEHEFITIKSRIAMLHDSFLDCLDHDQNVGQNILTIVTRSITLKHVHRMSTAEIKKIELEWHESYLLLNETLGVIDERRKQFAGVTPSEYYRKMYTRKFSNAFSTFIYGWVFKAIVGVIALSIALVVAVQFGLWDKVINMPTTRNLVVKGEDMIRIVYREYPYRDISSWTRMDTQLSNILKLEKEHAESDKGYTPQDGANRLQQAMGSGPNDIADELKKAVAGAKPSEDYRTENYAPGQSMGGDNPIVWLIRLPSVQAARNVEARYRAWLGGQPAGTKPNWALFRSSNAIGWVFGGDQEGLLRDYLVNQYTYKRAKK